MGRPIDINKLAARAQQAAKELNPPARQAAEAITRRATKGGLTIRVEGTTGVLPKERTELSSGQSLETGETTAQNAWAGGTVTSDAVFKNVQLTGRDTFDNRSWVIQGNGVMASYSSVLTRRSDETNGASMSPSGQIVAYAADGITANVVLYGVTGAPSRFAIRPEVGPFGSTVQVALKTDTTPAAFQQFYSDNDWINTAYSLGAQNVAFVSVAIPANTLVGVPVRLSIQRRVTGLSVFVSTAASGLIRFSLGKFNTQGTEVTILENSGTINPSTTGAKTLAIDEVLDPGWYEVLIHSNVAISVSGLASSAFLTTPWDALGTGGETVGVGGLITRKLVYSVARSFASPATSPVLMQGINMTTGAVPMINVRSAVP